jgi:hypothetical protein
MDKILKIHVAETDYATEDIKLGHEDDIVG